MLSIEIHMDFRNYQLDTQFDIAQGEIAGLFGKSGIGKSTLLKVVAGLYKPKYAKISVEDDFWNHSERDIFKQAQQRSVGLVFQDFALFPNLTVYDNLKFAQNISTTEMNKLINVLDIMDILDQKPNNISGGQKQRVAIGRSIAYNPKVLLMDEPFAALDDEIKDSIKGFLKDYIKEKRKIAIIASHDISDLEYFGSTIIKLTEKAP